MNKTHELKIAPEYFKAVVEGVKTFELRYNDRNFKVGDTIILKEYEHLFDMEYRHTGKEVTREISYILKGGIYGLSKGYVILGLKVKNDEILKEINLRIQNYKLRIEKRKGSNFHDEAERIRSFEDEIYALGVAKEYILKLG